MSRKVGTAGEHLVCYDLLSNGYDCCLVPGGLEFDLILTKDNDVLRVQVKSVTNVEKDKKHHRFGIIRRCGKEYYHYGDNAFEIYAFVFLNEKEVFYMNKKSVTNKRSLTLRLEDKNKYTIEECLNG